MAVIVTLSITNSEQIPISLCIDIVEWNYNQFTEIRKIESGYAATVHRSAHKQTQQPYAIKQICKKTLRKEGRECEIKDEVAILTRLSHPNIIQLYASFEDQDYAYLVLEPALGDIHNCLLKGVSPLSEQTVKQIVRVVVSATLFCHQNGIIHRDIKPENILLMADGTYRLCDFNLSIVSSDVTAKEHRKYCGTTEYLPPEMLKGKPYNHQIDIWSIGILTHELLTGMSPFLGENDYVTMDNILHCSPSWNKANASTDFIGRLLRKNPDDRMSLEDALRHPFLNPSAIV